MHNGYQVFTNAIVAFLALNIALPAFGDGLWRQELTATLSDRKAALLVQVNPPILTPESVKNASLFLKFYDPNTNKTFQHVSYFVKVEKEGKLLMKDLFHSHTGELNLKIDPKINAMNIYGCKESIQDSWVECGGPIVVQAPIFLEGGLYHFAIEVDSIDFDNNLFKPEDAPKFDSWLSVGDISENKLRYQQNDYNISIISYYDRIKDFSFSEQTQQISFTMPFNWDTQRLNSVPIFVHEEIRVPRNFTIFSSGMFNGTVNGMEIPDYDIIVDDSNPDYYVVHYMLKKDDILKFASELQADPNAESKNLMVFTLTSKEAIPEFPVNLMVITAVGLVGALIALRLKSDRGLR